MNRKRKILVPIFNRAHYGRLRSVLNAIKNHPRLELQIIVAVPAAYGGFFNNLAHSRPRSWHLALPWYILARTRSFLGQEAVLRNDFLARSLKEAGFRINDCIPLFFDGGNSVTMAKSVGQGIIKLVGVMKKLKPDVVFVNADRFEMMAVAIAASYLNIPVAHNEGGDVSGTLDENVRHAITKLAHIHFTSTSTSRRRVIQMGENPDKVFAVGSPAIDAVSSADLDSLKESMADFSLDRTFLLVLLHPVATLSGKKNMEMTQNVILALKELKLPVIFLGSNIDAGSNVIGYVLREWLEKDRPRDVYFVKHLPPDDFYKVLTKTACAIGNSSSFIREGAYLGTPVVLVGSRQNNRERTDNVIEIDYSWEEIVEAVNNQLKRGKYSSSSIFGDGTAGKKIADILAGIELNVQKSFNDLQT
ncbi:MAG: UDP-N-acetylglucosamine 2-epimerase [Patescibacteria group bacterium]